MHDVTDYLELEAIERLIGAAQNTRDVLLLKVLTRTGRRVSEVVGQRTGHMKSPGLRPNDILDSMNALRFTVLKSKGDKVIEGVSVVPPDLIAELHSYAFANSLILNDKLFPISRQRVHQILRSCAARADIQTLSSKPLHVHCLRHSFAVHFARNCNTPSQLVRLKEALGHRDVNTTMFYIQKFNQGEMAEIINRMWRPKDV